MEMERFIAFIIDLTNDEDILGYYNAKDYYLNGGCLQLADIIHRIIPDTEYLIKKDLKHLAVLYNDNAYDATGLIDKSDYSIISEEYLYNIRHFYGRIEYEYINGISYVDYFIDLIKECRIEDLINELNNKKNTR